MKSYLFLFSFFIAQFGSSQVDVDFDYYLNIDSNDYTDKFFEADDFSYITTGGITGGALEVPDETDLNQRVTYVKGLKSDIGKSYKSSICFKYNSNLINPNGFNTTAGIWLNYETSNNYIYARISNGNNLNIHSYNWVASNHNVDLHLNLENGKWYRLELSVNVIGGTFNDEVFVQSEVFDLGNTGLSSEVSLGVSEGYIYHTGYTNNTVIDVSFFGSKWGGTEIMDNFNLTGVVERTHLFDFTLSPSYNTNSYAYITGRCTKTPYYNDNNKFIIQVSDKDGDFNQVTNLDTVAGTTYADFQNLMPSNFVSSGNYKLRFISTSPIDTTNSSEVFEIINSANSVLAINSPQIFFPNPVADNLKIDVKNYDSFILFDPLGKTLIKQDEFSNVIDLSFLNSGVYNAFILSDGVYYTARIVKR